MINHWLFVPTAANKPSGENNQDLIVTFYWRLSLNSSFYKEKFYF